MATGVPTGITVRAAAAGDAAAIARIRVRGWRAAYRGIVPDAYLDALTVESSAQEWHRYLSEPGHRGRVVVAEDAGGVIGFAAAGPSRDDDLPDAISLHLVYLDPARRRAGIGSRLVEGALSGLRGRNGSAGPILVWTFEANTDARAFYQRLGFVPDGCRRTEAFGGAELGEIRLQKAIVDDRGAGQ